MAYNLDMGPNDKILTVNINFTTVIKTVVLLLFIYALFLVKELLIIVLASIIIASAIDPFVRLFGRIKIPRPFAVGIIFSALIAFVVSATYILVPIFVEQLSGFILIIPDFLSRLDFLAQSNTYFAELNVLKDIQIQLSNVDIVSTIKAALFGAGGGIIQIGRASCRERVCSTV